MKHFLFKITFFSFLIASLAYGFDYMIQEGIKTSNYREVTKWNEVITGRIDAQLLIVGSSRALVHFDCEKIEEVTGMTCYNLGFDGTNYPLQKLMLELYLSKNQRPKKIIWSLDYHSFEPVNGFYGFEQLIPYQSNAQVQSILDLNKTTPSYLYRTPIIRYSFNPKMKYNGFLSYLGLYSRAEILKKGYRKQDKEWDGSIDSLVLETNQPKTQVFNKILFDDFLEFNINLQADSTEIQWVLAPYYEDVNFLIVNQKELINYFKTTAETLKISFFDFTQVKFIHSKKNFYNRSHLNLEGVQLFMDELEIILKK